MLHPVIKSDLILNFYVELFKEILKSYKIMLIE